MIKEFIFDRTEGNHLSYLDRFNGQLTIQKRESVAEHTYWVTFFCNIIFKEAFEGMLHNENERELYYKMKNFVLERCLFHDEIERLTGDIIYTTKYNNIFGFKFREILTDIERNLVRELPDGLYKDQLLRYEIKSGGVSSLFHPVLLKVIKLCDWISCLQYAWQEITLGNHRFGYILEYSVVGIYNSCLDIINMLDKMDMPGCSTKIFQIIQGDLVFFKDTPWRTLPEPYSNLKNFFK